MLALPEWPPLRALPHHTTSLSQHVNHFWKGQQVKALLCAGVGLLCCSGITATGYARSKFAGSSHDRDFYSRVIGPFPQSAMPR